MIGFALKSARAAYAVQGQLAHQRDGLPSQLGTSTVNFCLFQPDWAATIDNLCCRFRSGLWHRDGIRSSKQIQSFPDLHIASVYPTCTASLFLTPARPGAQRTGRDRRLHRGHL